MSPLLMALLMALMTVWIAVAGFTVRVPSEAVTLAPPVPVPEKEYVGLPPAMVTVPATVVLVWVSGSATSTLIW